VQHAVAIGEGGGDSLCGPGLGFLQHRAIPLPTTAGLSETPLLA
jgi:hypothetical protein